MKLTRRSILASLGLALPIPLWQSRAVAAQSTGPVHLGLRSVEDAVRQAFATPRPVAEGSLSVRRVEVGHCELLQRALPGCHNDRPFAGFPAGHLRILRTGCEPGPVVGGVRLYVSTIDVADTGGRIFGPSARRFDFASLPPAATLSLLASDARASSARKESGRVTTSSDKSA